MNQIGQKIGGVIALGTRALVIGLGRAEASASAGGQGTLSKHGAA